MTRIRPLRPHLLVAALLLPVLPAPAEGQVVLGRLIDDQTGDPVSTANIRLLRGSRGNDVIAVFITDEAGGFLLNSEGEGRVRLKADRIGYAEVTSPPFDLIGTDTIEVELRMAVEAVPLAPLTVVSKRAPLVLPNRYELGGFLERGAKYGRNGMGYGEFLVKEDWEHRSPGDIADILREVSGLRILGRDIRMRITGFDPRGCSPEWYLDGHHIQLRTERINGVVFKDRIENLVPVSTIAAIEVYTGISKPAQFMDMGGNPCGAIVVWSF